MCVQCDLLQKQRGSETLVRSADPATWAQNGNRRGFLKLAGAGAFAATAAACATNTYTGRNQLILVDDGQMAQMALSAWQQQRQQTPIWRNATQQARLERIGSRIANAAGRGNQPWEYALFDSPEKNAFVLPGNKVGFYRGLWEFSQRDDEIAIVLGHETGHVVGRHAAERYSQGVASKPACKLLAPPPTASWRCRRLALASNLASRCHSPALKRAKQTGLAWILPMAPAMT